MKFIKNSDKNFISIHWIFLRSSRLTIIFYIFFSTSSNCTSCGRTNLSERIVGGNETEIHEFPWHVGIIKSNQIGLRPFCGGTLISEKFDSSSYLLTFLLSQKSLSSVHGSSWIWTCRISNICCCFLQASRVKKIKTNIQNSTRPN